MKGGRKREGKGGEEGKMKREKGKRKNCHPEIGNTRLSSPPRGGPKVDLFSVSQSGLVIIMARTFGLSGISDTSSLVS